MIGCDKCTFCNDIIETCSHLFFECTVVSNLYKGVYVMLNIINEWSKIQWKDVFLGNYENQFSVEIDMLLLFWKYFVYHCKYQQVQLNELQFVSFLKIQSDIETFCAQDT